jgi:hypothetical protein
VDKIACNINLRYDGFADNGDGALVALFGYESTAAANFHPKQNQVNTVPPSNPQPTPPYDLAPGSHPGSFRPVCAPGQTITWTVDGQSKTADCGDQTRKLTATAIGTGWGVVVDDGNNSTQVVMLKPDLSP